MQHYPKSKPIWPSLSPILHSILRRSILNISFLASTFFLFDFAHSATVDTISIHSQVMHKNIKCVVIQPTSSKDRSTTYPAVYLLHGYGGSYNNWILRVPELADYADQYQLIIICPDGGYSSWYIDSPIDPSFQYESYIAEEVPAYIDSHYPTFKSRESRAITGLSMGGHGGLYLGFRHADLFGACGSMSGVVDLYSARNNYDLGKRIGDTITHSANWKNYSVINLIEHYPKDSLAIIIDCGTEDFFFPLNYALHVKMQQLKIPHDYIERPGKHDWNYWRNSIKYQLLYFKDFFAVPNRLNK